MKSLFFVATIFIYCSGYSQEQKPNVIFVIFDDLNDTVEGLGGHPQANTPHLDRLMVKGVKFTHAYTNAPLCAPSRPSLLTSVYPHTSGCFNAEYNAAIAKNWRELPPLNTAKTFMEHFKDNGYKVFGTGKIFHNGEEDWSVWLDPHTGEMNFGHYPSWGPYAWDGKQTFIPFTVSHTDAVQHPSFPDVGKLSLFTHLADIPVVQPDPAKDIPGYTGWREFGRPFHYKNENERDLMADERSAEWVSNIVQKDMKDPFMMCIGFNRPHGPWIAPKKYFDMFPLENIELANVNENDLEDIADILKSNKRLQRRKDEYFEYKKKGYDKLWTQAYLACVAYADEQLGKVLDAVENSNYADNTLIVVTSDHGFHMGEKLRYFKHSVWEESTKVPLIISGPGIPENKFCNTPVSLIDIYPTLINYTKLPENPHQDINIEGHSLMPLLKDPEAGNWDGPSIAISVIGLNRFDDWSTMDHHFSARSQNFRYVLCSNGEEELYDHRNDPYEWNNIYNDPEYRDIKNDLRRELLNLIGNSKYRPDIKY